MPTTHVWKQLHESEYDSHESEIEFHFDIETSRLLGANLFRQNILTTKHIKKSANRLVTTD